MKQKDIATIIVIAFISVIVSFLVSNKLFVTPSNREQQVEKVDTISTEFNTPSTKYFNKDSLDPAPSTAIGSDNNQNPFSGSGQ